MLVRKNITWFCGCLAAVALVLSGRIAYAQSTKLWYKQPAEKWTDALPIGNGRMGGMIYGGIQQEHIQFNEQTLWTGGPRAYQRNGAVKYLEPIRKLLAAGKQAEAESLADKHFMGMKNNEATYVADSLAWLKKTRKDTIYAAANFNAADWKTITLPSAAGWEVYDGFEGLDGAVWLRTSFDVSADMAGKNMVLSIGRVRDVDFTYVNGKLIGSSNNTKDRKYTIPAGTLKSGKNTIAIQVFNFFDKGGLTTVKQPFAVYPEDEPAKAIPLKSEWKYFIQNNNPPAFPRYNADYQPFGDVYFDFPVVQASNYRRELDVSNAVSKVSYQAKGINYTREYFASAPAQVIAAHFTADKPGHITVKALLKTLHRICNIQKINSNTLALSLKVRNSVMIGKAYLTVQTKGGKVKVTAKDIAVTGADEAAFYITAATNFKSYKDVTADAAAICKKNLAGIAGKNYAQLKAEHIKDYQKYCKTFSIDLGKGPGAELPTDERILSFAKTPDPSFISLYVNYGRYLLISSSRPNSQPANLQGLWNNLLTPPWGSKYTTNINVEMNYWPAELLNLSDCSQPLFNMTRELAETGKLTAKEHYGAPGWVLHHNTDQWRGTAPVNSSTHGIWVTGGAWLCQQLWEHYLCTLDKNFLQNSAYPEMKGAAEFFVNFLTNDAATGYLISNPSNSPEHGGLVAGPAMDHQIIRQLLKNCIAAADVLDTDKAFADTLKEKLKQIAPDKVGRYGQLQEWVTDLDDTADTHRHVSHMWAVYPGNEITPATPALMNAAVKSMNYRGDEGTGWSIAWKVNIWARMKQADHAYLMFTKLLSPADVTSGKEKGGVYHNLFDAHPPFQIDGNFGGSAGIAEMLLQSQNNEIELLPALPSALPVGKISGICARGGFELAFNWQQRKLQAVQVTSKAGGVCRLRYQQKTIEFKTQKGKTYRFDDALKQL
jgi:alpha-L-fucosidase 2